jgi:CRISPR-associated protein Csb2
VTHMLTLEIEFLTSVCFAARPQGNPTEEPDWPPQPDRVFSALVAAWGVRGELTTEKAALEWLEQQPPPAVQSTEYHPRRVGISFVPPNDAKGNAQVLPEHRRRQPRLFPAAIPDRPILRLVWDMPPEPSALDALQALARDTSYLGHSASVVRCRFLLDAPPDPELNETAPKRRVYPGRLESLRQSYKRGEHPTPGEVVAAWHAERIPATPHSVFSDQWIVLEHGGGECPDLRGIAVVARRMRNALMSRYGAAGLPVPEAISGHVPDGSPSSNPHLMIVPLADVGFQYSSGRLMGIALVFPQDVEQQRRAAERDWLAGLDDRAGTVSEWRSFDRLLSEVTELELGSLGVWKLQRTLESGKQSLQISRYTHESKRWSSVTPIVLDRFPKAKDFEERDHEIAAILASSCVNIGLPEPQSVQLYKHAAARGALSAYPSGHAPAWSRWAQPGSLANRLLTHVVLEFREPVRGPVVIGAGRYAGLGLCVGE